MTFDPVEIFTGSKVILYALAEEGEPGNEANTLCPSKEIIIGLE